MPRIHLTILIPRVSAVFPIEVADKLVDTLFMFCRILGFEFCYIHKFPSYRWVFVQISRTTLAPVWIAVLKRNQEVFVIVRKSIVDNFYKILLLSDKT